MAELFSPEYWLLWAAILAVALFFPVRQLIWVLYVRRAQNAQGAELEEAEKDRLKRRAAATAALLCAVFSVLYTLHLYSGR